MQIRKEEIKMFADDIIVYRENAKESAKKKNYRTNKGEFSKVTKYKKTYENQLYFYILAMSV